MPLTLVLGPANSAKAGEVLGRVRAPRRRAARSSSCRPRPTPRTTRASWPRSGAVLGSVLTFSGLAREIAVRAGYAGRRLTPLQRERVLERALAGVRFEALRRGGRHRGIPDRRRRADRRARALAGHPAAVRRRDAGPGPQQDPRRAGYARDVAAIYGPTPRRSSGSAGSTASCTPGARSTPSAPRRVGGDPSRCSSTASTTCIRSSATRSRRSPGWWAPRSPSR